MNLPAFKVSQHGKDRFTQRVCLDDQAEVFFLYLYLFGREPTDEELKKDFDCKRIGGREYRVCWHGVHYYLIVFDPVNKVFVTLWSGDPS